MEYSSCINICARLGPRDRVFRAFLLYVMSSILYRIAGAIFATEAARKQLAMLGHLTWKPSYACVCECQGRKQTAHSSRTTASYAQWLSVCVLLQTCAQHHFLLIRTLLQVLLIDVASTVVWRLREMTRLRCRGEASVYEIHVGWSLHIDNIVRYRKFALESILENELGGMEDPATVATRPSVLLARGRPS